MVQFMGVCGGNYKKFWILRWASFIFRLLPSLNKCVPFLLGRYSTTMRGECEQECFSYLLSSMWFLAAVWLSPLFGGHIVLESRLIGKLFLRVFWGFLSLVEYISEKPVNSKCSNCKVYSRQRFWRLRCCEDPAIQSTSFSFDIHLHLPQRHPFSHRVREWRRQVCWGQS